MIPMSMMKLSGLVLCLLFFLAVPVFAVTPEPPAKPQSYVVDLADVINADVEAQLNAYLRELDQKSTAQVLILTVKSLDGEDISGFSLRMAEQWKPGQKGKNNGVLMTVAVTDRKYRIEVGYGLEPLLPDSFVGTLGREQMVPYFRKGDFGTGIQNAALVIVRKIAEADNIEITGMPQRVATPRQESKSGWSNLLLYALLFGGIPLFFFLSQMMRNRAGGGRGGHHGAYWGSGGGFGGGSFGGGGDSGGFSGGGGDFGGGGAGGDW
jgi:uncharacterized protein